VAVTTTTLAHRCRERGPSTTSTWFAWTIPSEERRRSRFDSRRWVAVPPSCGRVCPGAPVSQPEQGGKAPSVAGHERILQHRLCRSLGPTLTRGLRASLQPSRVFLESGGGTTKSRCTSARLEARSSGGCGLPRRRATGSSAWKRAIRSARPLRRSSQCQPAASGLPLQSVNGGARATAPFAVAALKDRHDRPIRRDRAAILWPRFDPAGDRQEVAAAVLAMLNVTS
jgi:hypothetical protein